MWLDDICKARESMQNIPLLPSSALAKLSLIITVNKLTPSPAHFGIVSKSTQNQKRSIYMWSDDICKARESRQNIPLLPSSALAKLSLTMTVNKLTPSPAHFGIVSKLTQN